MLHQENAINDSNHVSTVSRSLTWWLFIVVSMIFCMVIIGGITRLTGSGLSMVEWRPLMGTLPPMSQIEWERVFNLYQQSPQYQQVNDWITMSDFKWIFFWEYLHRLFGRMIGLVFALPWFYFLIKGYLKGSWFWRSTAALIFGGSQGLLGWYMVKSGLVDMPHVSHFRLAAHLSLAFFCGQWVWSMLIDLNLNRFKHLARYEFEPDSSTTEASYGMDDHTFNTQPVTLSLSLTFFALLILQIVYGAFMAGSRAGYLYTTYPTMNGSWIAPTWFDDQGELILPAISNLLSHPDSIHFIHRSLALVVLVLGFYLVWKTRQQTSLLIKRLGLALGFMLAVQFLLGVITVTSGMNIAIAAAHQGGSFLLLTATLTLIQCSYRLSK